MTVEVIVLRDAWAADEVDMAVEEPDPDLIRIRFDPHALREHLTPIRDAARAEKARLRAAKRAAEQAAARPSA